MARSRDFEDGGAQASTEGFADSDDVGCAGGGQELVSVAADGRGLRRDFDAVTAGFTLPWSSGPVEGHVNGSR